jgi:hypothetical protein
MPLPRTLRKVALVAAAALAAAAVAGYLARNAIAASVLRSTGSSLLGVRVDVHSVNLDLFGLGVELEGLSIANPEGWGAPEALTADRIRVELSGDTRPSRLVVEGIDLDGVAVWFINDGTHSNINAIVQNIPKSPDAGRSDPAAGSSTELLIRRLTVTGTDVRYAPRSSAKADVPVVAHLGKVEVREIGGNTTGSDIAEQLVGQVFEAVVLAVAKESAGKLPEVVGGALQKSIVAGGHFGAAAVDALGGVAKGAGDAVGGFFKGIGDAFSGGKKEP